MHVYVIMYVYRYCLVYVMIFKTGAKFNVDLSQNKAHVKILIQEEISKLVDEDDEVEGEEEMDG